MKYCDACKTSYPNDFAVCPRDQSTLRVTSELMQGVIIRNKYEVLEKIGVGGMATVYKARHRTFGELRALKLVSSKLLDDELFMKRFKTEAIVTRKLKHPNAVRVEDFDETEDGRPFIVMEYVEGRNLRHVIHEAKVLPLERALSIARQTAAALAAAHQLGITHRDIKPDNILLLPLPDGSEQVKVLDFGIAKLKEGSIEHTSYTPTQTGLVMGTPQYISPEQALGRTGEEIDGRADIYSLGVVLYEMLTGELPFHSDTPLGLLMAHVHTVPTPPHALKPDLPPAISQLLLKCLEKDRARRYASADELLEALSRPQLTATTDMLGSSTLGAMAETPSAAASATPAPSLATPVTAPLTPAPRPAAALATPPGTPATAPLTPLPKRPTPAPIAAAAPAPARPAPAAAAPRAAAPGRPVTPPPKSHKGIYTLVIATAAIVLLLAGYAVFRPQPAALPPPLDPAKVTAQIQRLLDSSPTLQKHPLTVVYANGIATLSGTVESQADSELAQALAANVPGVNTVTNQLTIQVPAETKAEAKLEKPAPEPQSQAKSEPEPAAGGLEEPIEDDASVGREQRVQRLIQAGNRDLNSRPPKGRKAYFEFQKALELDPGNSQALAGMQRLERMRRQGERNRLNPPR